MGVTMIPLLGLFLTLGLACAVGCFDPPWHDRPPVSAPWWVLQPHLTQLGATHILSWLWCVPVGVVAWYGLAYSPGSYKCCNLLGLAHPSPSLSAPTLGSHVCPQVQQLCLAWSTLSPSLCMC